MIIEAEKEHIPHLALMLAEMYHELFPAHASTNMNEYITEIVNHYNNPKDTVYIDSELRGFFIVRDETEAIAPTLKRYNGIRVYIKEEHRKGRLLAEFYARLFEDFPDGEILGQTEINSEHIAVLDKRHEAIAKVYRLKRRN
jgi:hypothetical protein